MDMGIYKSKFSKNIIQTENDYMDKIKELYKGDVLYPKLQKEQLLKKLETKYHIVLIDILTEDIDNYTLRTVNNYIERKMCSNIWRLLNNSYTELFYKDFYESFVRINDTPFICLIYDAGRNEFYSNSYYLEALVRIERGIDLDNDQQAREYKHYLNTLYQFNKWLFENGL